MYNFVYNTAKNRYDTAHDDDDDGEEDHDRDDDVVDNMRNCIWAKYLDRKKGSVVRLCRVVRQTICI